MNNKVEKHTKLYTELEPPVYQLNQLLYSKVSGVVMVSGSKVKLRSKESRLLNALIDEFPNTLTREKIETLVYNGNSTRDSAINQVVKRLRDNLIDTERGIILTIPKTGYVLGVVPQVLPLNDLQNMPFHKEDRIISQLLKHKLNGGTIALLCLCFAGTGYLTSYYLSLSQSYLSQADITDSTDKPNSIKINDTKQGYRVLGHYQVTPFRCQETVSETVCDISN